LIGNHIDVVGDAGFGDMVDAGRGRLLLTFTESRLQKYPDVPTAKELGYDVVVKSPLGIAGPKDMDPKIVKILHDAFMKATNDPTFKRTLEIQGQPQIYMSSKDYTRYAAEQFAEDKRFISELKMKLE
jgi:tripartite-type tricarboxylate transporter receptor subunit TctC